MRMFRLTCAEESTVNYYVIAEDEDEARDKLLDGEHDDYDTIGSSIVDIVEVEDRGEVDGVG